MTNGTHESAVQLLTDHQRFVRLVVQREVKGPLEPPSPHSPSYLKGLSPSGYMANRPGYKRPSISSFVESPTADTQKTVITNTSPVVPQQFKSNTQSPSTPTTGKTNGISSTVPQPVPAPRRLTSQSSVGSGINGQSNTPQNGNRSEDDDIQVMFYIITKSHFEITMLMHQEITFFGRIIMLKLMKLRSIKLLTFIIIMIIQHIYN